nr:reverse transcriptase domain-containing protein [Tanacetum cinerariifolium]
IDNDIYSTVDACPNTCEMWKAIERLFKDQFYRGDHRPDLFILLEAITSNDLWIWHAFFIVSEMNNNMNGLRQSPLFNALKPRKAPDVPPHGGTSGAFLALRALKRGD